MVNEKLFEYIYNYSDNDGLLSNELAEPLEEDNMEKIFEKIYFEGNLKPLFEQVLREMANLPYQVGYKTISDIFNQNIDTDSEKVRNVLYNLMKRANGDNTHPPVLLDANGIQAEPEAWLNSILTQIENERNKAFQKSVDTKKQIVATEFTEVLKQFNVNQQNQN